MEENLSELQEALQRVMSELQRRQTELARLETLKNSLADESHSEGFRRVMTAHEIAHLASNRVELMKKLKKINDDIKEVTKGIERAQERAVELQEAMEEV